VFYDTHSGITQWNAVFSAAFHAFGRDRPNPIV
jgi:hypothetical protein